MPKDIRPPPDPFDRVKAFLNDAQKEDWHQHVNPDGSIGGWVQNTPVVSATAYVASSALVYGCAKVLDRARVEAMAKVYEEAMVSDSASISGSVKLFGRCRITGASEVCGRAIIGGDTVIGGKSRVVDSFINADLYQPPRAGSCHHAADSDQLAL
jgi:NDP-sugar pyrophosphorylase family protein